MMLRREMSYWLKMSLFMKKRHQKLTQIESMELKEEAERPETPADDSKNDTETLVGSDGEQAAGAKEVKPESTNHIIKLIISKKGGEYVFTLPAELLRDNGQNHKIGETYQANTAVATIEPASYEQSIMSYYATEWKEAMKDELQSHFENHTWDLVPKEPNMRILENRWLFKLKRTPT